MIGRIATALLALTLLLLAGSYLGAWRFELTPSLAEMIGWRQGLSEEDAMRRDLQWRASSTAVSSKIDAALERNDVDDAAMYSGLAHWAEISLSSDVTGRLANAQSTAQTTPQDLNAYAKGFVFGAPASFSAIASSIAADNTVVGDIRDISEQGSKLINGDRYDDVILGLAVVGIAATTKTAPTEGGGAVIKSGASLLKFAERLGLFKDEFNVHVRPLIGAAVDFKKLEVVLKDVDLTNLTKTQSGVVDYAQTIEPAPLFPILADMDALCTAAGIGECMRLVSLANTPQDLAPLVQMAKAAGPRTRGIIELTGMTKPGSFKNSVDVFQLFGENVIILAIWIFALIGLSAWQFMTPARDRYQPSARSKSSRRR